MDGGCPDYRENAAYHSAFIFIRSKKKMRELTSAHNFLSIMFRNGNPNP